MHTSVWNNGISIPEFKELKGDIKTDVLIIGGGIAGILCAFYLKKAGINCILVEANKIFSGVTQNTTAKLTLQHGLIYNRLINYFGLEKAKMYYEANLIALEEYFKLCENIDCDFEKKSMYIYSMDDTPIIEYEVDAIQRLGYNASFEMPYELPFKTAGAVKTIISAQFNPIKFLTQIVKDLNIYEHTLITDIEGNTATYENGKITAENIIVATHFPFINNHGNYFIKLYQHRSYVCAYRNLPSFKNMYADESLKGLSFRSYKDMLLIGGSGHRTGKKTEAWNGINSFVQKYYATHQPACSWATQDCMSLDGVPYIGQYSKNTKNLYVTTGFNKWGMTSAMVSAKILVGMLQSKVPDYSEVFSPQRSILKPQLVVNSLEAVAGYAMPIKRRCPHLGCALKWNKLEHSWDCPCHGSRFAKDGKLINNPAIKDAKT